MKKHLSHERWGKTQPALCGVTEDTAFLVNPEGIGLDQLSVWACPECVAAEDARRKRIAGFKPAAPKGRVIPVTVTRMRRPRCGPDGTGELTPDGQWRPSFPGECP